MARAKLNSILVALIVAVGRLSAAGHDFCATSNMNFGIRVPSANHSTHWQTTFTTGFNHQPLILLEPTGIYGLRADGLSGWQKTGVCGSEFLVGLVCSTPFAAATAAYAWNHLYLRSQQTALLAGAVYAAGTGLLSGTGTWTFAHFAFRQDVKWWQTVLGAGLGAVTAVGMIEISNATSRAEASGAWRGSFSTLVCDITGVVGGFGFFLLPPLGAVIGVNHR
jgi:hypothetical protein